MPSQRYYGVSIVKAAVSNSSDPPPFFLLLVQEMGQM